MFPKKKDNSKEETQAVTPHEQPKTESAPPTSSGQAAPDAKELQKQLDQLRKHTESLQKEKNDIFAKLQRVAADYDNYQKRSSKQIADSVNYEKDKIIKSLLPALDNFDHILANLSCGVNDKALLKGVRIIYDQMLGVLKSHGVEQITSAGEKFDPALHEALTQRAEQDKDNGVVLEELQKGYKLSGRVIRPSRVIVNMLPSTQPAQQPEEPETKDTQ
jgi:molecular chaperone GrpE